MLDLLLGLIVIGVVIGVGITIINWAIDNDWLTPSDHGGGGGSGYTGRSSDGGYGGDGGEGGDGGGG